ncbi:hypothetical protein WN944_018755 [Citrus x changshan-huyou]|uniref:Uncharacterized protein n=1 Tax=Citrus x changshan-huyou TaxID=2935761 RepID=A0AAP0LVC3_9ROSI
MKATYFLSFVLFVACNMISDSLQNSSTNHHQFRLVLMWPPGYCKFQTCRANIPRSFVIHGLWSVNESGIPLNYCSGKKFDINKMVQTKVLVFSLLSLYIGTLVTF